MRACEVRACVFVCVCVRVCVCVCERERERERNDAIHEPTKARTSKLNALLQFNYTCIHALFKLFHAGNIHGANVMKFDIKLSDSA